MITVHIGAPYACFTRPELSVERYSYDVPTPSACRGIFESIYWKPGFQWQIRKIQVIKPIQDMNITRNEVGFVGNKVSAKIIKSGGDDNLGKTVESDGGKGKLRSARILKDVAYRISATPRKCASKAEFQKHTEITLKRLRKGANFSQAYMGCREFSVEEMYLIEDEAKEPKPIQESCNFGLMLYDIDYKNDMTPMFFNAKMVNGVIEVPEDSSSEIIR